MLYPTVALGLLFVHVTVAKEAIIDINGNVIQAIDSSEARRLEHRGPRENCADDPDYISPIAFGTNCDFFGRARCECSAFSALFTRDEMIELYSHCPISCEVPCDYVVPDFPTASPTATPTIKSTGDCEDDPSYMWEGKLSCANIAGIGLGCDLSIFSETIDELKQMCPATCDPQCSSDGVGEPTPSPTVCVDDPNHESIVNPEYGCEMYVYTQCPRWGPIFEILGGGENMVGDVMKSCPLSCGLCGTITNRPTIAPPTKSPTARPTLSPTSSPTSSPTVSPTKSPSAKPSSTLMCYDNDDYISPVDETGTRGCDFYAELADNGECDCSVWEQILSDQHIIEMYQNCPITCDKPCGYLHTPTSAPTAAPDTTCVDDPTYVSPINSAFGCEFHLFTPQDCLYWCPVHISPEELVELLDRCPHSCGLCGEDTNPDTLAPTISPSRGCRDDPTYIHPTKPMWTCETFKTANCMELRPIFEPDDFADLLHRCPEACDVPCDYTPPPTESRTGSPTMQPSSRPSSTPSIKPTVSQSPTDCLDDRDYIFPLNQNWGCEEIHDNEVDCLSYRHDLLPEEFLELVRKCPKACHVSCDYTIPPTMSPTVAPTSKPSPSPSLKPSTSAAPTDCLDYPAYVLPFPLNPNENFGCQEIADNEINCLALRSLSTPEGFLEMLRACPKACNVPCDYTPPPTVSPTAKPSSSPSSKPSSQPSSQPSSNPTAQPSARPTSSPSSKPSTSPSLSPTKSFAPTDCNDDPTYVTPGTTGWTCRTFEALENCLDERPLFPDAAAFTDMLHRCPKACNVPCDYTPPPTVSPSAKPTFIVSDPPSISAQPSFKPSEVPSIAPSNCKETPDCAAYVCIQPDEPNLNRVLGGEITFATRTSRSNKLGPLDGNYNTYFNADDGSTYESNAVNVVQWWQVTFPTLSTITDIKLFACRGPSCHPEGLVLDNIRIDIKVGNVVISSFSFGDDFGNEMEVILPFPVTGSSVRITKMQAGQVLSLNEVEIIGTPFQ